MITATHQRPAAHLLKTKIAGCVSQLLKFFRGPIASNRYVGQGWAQVLAQGEALAID